MEDKRFRKNDEGFICAVCGHKVSPLKYSSRDHCPKCLSSIHIDILPGDRANPCKGILKPIQTLPDSKKGFIIIYLLLALIAIISPIIDINSVVKTINSSIIANIMYNNNIIFILFA